MSEEYVLQLQHIRKEYPGVVALKDVTLEFEVIIAEIQTFIEPVFDAIVDEEEWKKNWTFKQKWNR